jgi:hypothetical protein
MVGCQVAVGIETKVVAECPGCSGNRFSRLTSIYVCLHASVKRRTLGAQVATTTGIAHSRRRLSVSGACEPDVQVGHDSIGLTPTWSKYSGTSILVRRTS